MTKSARKSFVGAIVFFALAITSVFFALELVPKSKTCSLLGQISFISTLLDTVLSYIPTVIFIVLVVIFGLLFFSRMKQTFKLWREGRPGPKFHFGVKQAVLLLIFILSFMPFILPLFDHGLNAKDHSIYNQQWNGSSKLGQFLNSSSTNGGLDYNIQGVESSLSTTMRNNETYKILVLLGPNRIYNPVTELPFFLDFINAGGSILVADDKGSTNWFLMELALFSGLQVPFLEFPKGDLADNASFIPGKNPYFPVVNNFEASHEITNTPWDIIGEGKGVALNHASAILSFGEIIATLLGGGGGGGSGLDVVGKSTESYSYIDMNGDLQFDSNVDKWDPSLIVDMLMSFVCVLTEEDKQALIDYASALMLGALPKTVFAASQLPHGRIFFAGDASFLNNQLLDDIRFSNKHFAANIFEWLAAGNSPDNVTIYFDEIHIRQEGFEEFNSPYIYGIFIGYVNWLSSSAILAWIYPFLALWTLSRWLPKDPEKEAKVRAKKEEKEKKGEVEEEFRIKYGSETAFVKKIKNLREGSDFNEPVLMLYRRVLRRLNRLLGDKEPTPDNIIILIKSASKKEITAKDDTRLREFFDTMDELKAKSGRKIDTENEFKDLFFEMTWVADWLNLNIV